MKEVNEFEVNEIDTRQNIQIPEKNIPVMGPGTVDAEMLVKMNNGFVRAKTLEAKLSYLIEMKMHLDARTMAGQAVTNDEWDVYDSAESYFRQHLRQAPVRSVGNVFRKMGELQAKYSHEVEQDKKWLRSMFPANDPDREKKVSYLAKGGLKSVARLKNVLDIERILVSEYSEDAELKEKLYAENKITAQTSMSKLADICGFKGGDKTAFLSSLKTSGEEKAHNWYKDFLKKEIFRGKVENGEIQIPEDDWENALSNPEEYDPDTFNAIEVDDFDIEVEIGAAISKQRPGNYYKDGKEKYIRDHHLTPAQVEKLNAAHKGITAEEKMHGHLADWVSEGGEGKKIHNLLKAGSMRAMINDEKKLMGGRKGYDQYIRLHCGYDAIHENPRQAKENLSKAVAASLMKKAGRPFNVDAIHAIAKMVKVMPEYQAITENPMRMIASLADMEAVERTHDLLINKTYGVEKNMIQEYVNKMDQLYEAMKPAGGQSTEYRAFRASVDAIRRLRELDLGTEAGRQQASEQIVRLNANLLSAGEQYMKGKKNVRGTGEGVLRFNNTLDAFGLLSQYAPGTKNQIMISVNRINKVRDVKPGQKDFVDITAYNEKRAIAAKNAADAQKAGKGKTAANKVQDQNKAKGK